jgi:ADP-heptose:LPS heptosyltransferase
MGDVAMTVPVLRALVQQNPTIKITFISRPFFKPLIEKIENVSFFAFDEKKRHKGFLGLLRLYFDLKKLKIDAFADLHNVLRSKIIRNLFALNGIKTAFINKGRADKKALTRSINKIFKQLPSVFERHQKVFQKLGFNLDLSKPIFPQKTNLSQEILNSLPNISFKNDINLIGIAPFAQYESKIYPLDLMQKVINNLALDCKNIIFLFGGGTSEIEQLSRLSKDNENVICIAGTMKFQEELKLISNLDLMLSMDSGNAHIAAMLGIRVITLWGATHPFSGFLPFNQPADNALISDRNLYPKLPTSIYGNKKVDTYQDAMRTITVENILTAIQNNLKNNIQN